MELQESGLRIPAIFDPVFHHKSDAYICPCSQRAFPCLVSGLISGFLVARLFGTDFCFQLAAYQPRQVSVLGGLLFPHAA